MSRRFGWVCGWVAVGLVAFGSTRAEARVPLLDPLVGVAVDGVLALAGRSSLDVFSTWEPDHSLARRARAEALFSRVLSRVRARPGLHRNPTLRLVRGDAEAPNAFSTGTSIFVSAALIDRLTDSELSAVLAHELAHAEEGHLTQRLGFPVGAALVHLGRVIQSDWNAIVEGRVDDFMREIWQTGQWQLILQSIEGATLEQELEADCVASHWLVRNWRAWGDPLPEDLVRSFVALTGVSERSLQEDPFLGTRIAQVRGGSCSR